MYLLSVSMWEVFWVFCEQLIPEPGWIHHSLISAFLFPCIVIFICLSVSFFPHLCSLSCGREEKYSGHRQVNTVLFGNKRASLGCCQVTVAITPPWDKAAPWGCEPGFHAVHLDCLAEWTLGIFLSQAWWDRWPVFVFSDWFHNLRSLQAWMISSASIHSPCLESSHIEKLCQGGRGQETIHDVTLISHLSCRAFIFCYLYKQLILNLDSSSSWWP